jgi:glycolate oxidase FAD binding subunit
MNDNHTALASSLAAVVGDQHITENHSLQINSLVPAFIVYPDSHTSVCDCLKICSQFNAAVVPAGAMTWLDGGNPLRRADVVLSLQRMNRVIDYSPPDLTATVEAGLTLAAFKDIARPENQWLPLDPPRSADSTLGAIAACASQGALRFGFGTPRDYVIGLRLAHIDGTESKCGGRVVKNVAGYDMNKLYVGSFGTLAVITELTFKLRPLSEREETIIATHQDLSRLIEAAKRIIASPTLQPASVFVTSMFQADADHNNLFIRFIESAATVAYQLNETFALLQDLFEKDTEIRVVPEKKETAWDTINQVDSFEGNTIVRLQVPLSTTATIFTQMLQVCGEYAFAAADFGTGIIRINFTASKQQAIELIKKMRLESSAVGGNLFIERASSEIKNQLGAWNDVGDLARLMRGLKRNFDPESLLNPGRFVAGI